MNRDYTFNVRNKFLMICFTVIYMIVLSPLFIAGWRWSFIKYSSFKDKKVRRKYGITRYSRD